MIALYPLRCQLVFDIVFYKRAFCVCLCHVAFELAAPHPSTTVRANDSASSPSGAVWLVIQSRDIQQKSILFSYAMKINYSCFRICRSFQPPSNKTDTHQQMNMYICIITVPKQKKRPRDRIKSGLSNGIGSLRSFDGLL